VPAKTIGLFTPRRTSTKGYYPILCVLHAPDDLEVISDAAKYFLTLSRYLEVFYWPSPKRAAYIKEQSFDQLGDSFTFAFKDYTRNSLKKVANEIVKPLELSRMSNIYFSGFAWTILSSCDRPASILPTLMQVRDSTSGTSFRKWLSEMDIALKKGNLRIIAQEIAAVQDVILEVRRDLGINEKEDKTIELQLGISPTLTLGDEVIKSIINRFKPKRHHLVFIRENFLSFLENSNVKDHLSYLFPIVRQFHQRY
jgi:hypothetical protein